MTCPICHSTETAFWYSARASRGAEGSFDLWRCADCTGVFIYPTPTWSELQPYYDRAYSEEQPWTSRSFPIPILPGMRVLDVGCGHGPLLRYCRERGAEATGVEPIDARAAICHDQGFDVYCGFLENWYTDKRFDLIVANHVLEHHPDPGQMLTAMRDLLDADGQIFIGVPNIDSVQSRTVGNSWYNLDIPLHLVHFNPQSLRMACEINGLSVSSLRVLSPVYATESWLKLVMRKRGLVPQRLWNYLPPLTPLASRLASYYDNKGRGEVMEIVCQL